LGTSIYPLRSIQSSKHGKYGSLGQDKRVGDNISDYVGLFENGVSPTKWSGYSNAANDDETYLLEGIRVSRIPLVYIYINTGWWFGTWLLFSPIDWDDDPI
jgi:hypothetical protein